MYHLPIGAKSNMANADDNSELRRSVNTVIHSMSTIVVCPNCKTEFEPTAAIAQSVKDDLTKEYNQKWLELSRQKDEQFRQEKKQLEQQRQERETQLLRDQQEQARRLEDEKKALVSRMEKELQAKVGADYENKLKMLEDANKTNEAKLTEARAKELDFLRKMQELKTKEQEMELEMQRKMIDERNRLQDLVKREEEEKNKLRETEFQMRLKEKDKQLEDQRKWAREYEAPIAYRPCATATDRNAGRSSLRASAPRTSAKTG
jgi:hypothetical protein